MLFREQPSAIRGCCPVQKAFYRGSVYDNDFIRTVIQKAARNAVRGALAGDAFHLVAKFFQILQVDGGDD